MVARIASLLPSATEIVCALGLAERVVGVSHECDFPPEIVGRPVLTEPKLDPRGTSLEIDAAVRGLVRDGLSVYRIRDAELIAARPDLIVTQQQCEVCAVSFTRGGGSGAHAADGAGGDRVAAAESPRPGARRLHPRRPGGRGRRGGRPAGRAEPRTARADSQPSSPRPQPAARRLHRMARPAHGGRQLGAGAGRARRRPLRAGRRGRIESVDRLGRPHRLRARRCHRHAVRVLARTDPPRATRIRSAAPSGRRCRPCAIAAPTASTATPISTGPGRASSTAPSCSLD